MGQAKIHRGLTVGFLWTGVAPSSDILQQVVQFNTRNLISHKSATANEQVVFVSPLLIQFDTQVVRSALQASGSDERWLFEYLKVGNIKYGMWD